jgi:hypothetical protein
VALPEVKVGHRFGHVFVRIVYLTKLGRRSVVARLEPNVADQIAGELRACAAGARKKPSKPTKLKIAR